MGFVHHITAAGPATGWMEKTRSIAADATHAAPLPTPTDLTGRRISATRAAGSAHPVRHNAGPPTPASAACIQGRRA
jgi:hypothetical protein